MRLLNTSTQIKEWAEAPALLTEGASGSRWLDSLAGRTLLLEVRLGARDKKDVHVVDSRVIRRENIIFVST